MLSVHHVAVLVRSLERAEAFYGGVLRLDVKQRWADERGDPRSIWFALGGGAFLAVERAYREPLARELEDAPRWHVVAFAIDAIERKEWRDRLIAAGYPIERETPYSIFTRDPDGNRVALSHHPVSTESALT